MNTGRFVFSQLMDFFPRHEFDLSVQRYQGEYRVRDFSCFDQFLCMTFAQLTFRSSLREIEICLRAVQPKLYHAGFRGRISRSTLADANEKRDWRIYADMAQVLIRMARRWYANEDFGVELEQTAYALDSTTIDLCLSLFPWAHFRRHKAAIKLHTLIDLQGNIPCFIRITHGKIHDVNILDQLVLEAGAFYMMDRGYIDFARLYLFVQALAFFVTRAKSNLDYQRMAYRPVDITTGLRSDQTIRLQGIKTRRQYPLPLRRISYVDLDTDKRLIFLTNNFTLPALNIAQLYRSRWQVELFFKWIKQNLCIKRFVGTSFNAVKTQVWIAVCVYVLVAIVKKQLHLERTLSEILQILSISLFEKEPLLQVLTANFHPIQERAFHKQITFNNF
jgi:transposase